MQALSLSPPTSLIRKVIWIIIFSIAMGYLETAVVVYLRELYYPDGFQFPLTESIDFAILNTEFWREIATIIMLVGIGITTGTTPTRKFAFFLLSFAIWDIFYYVFLYLLLGWPESLFTWDILFLVPAPWVGPVLTPVIISCLMIVLSGLLIKFNRPMNAKEWFLSISGSAVVIFSWMLDYMNFSGKRTNLSLLTTTDHNGLFSSTSSYVPESFNWWIFGLGVALLIASLAFYYGRNFRLKGK